MSGTRSRELFEQAQKSIPGGVNSPVRAFRSVGGDPVFVARGKGAHLWDVDGKQYLDFVGSWGPLIVGHAHPEVIEAITKAAADGTSFGAPTEREVKFAERIRGILPSIEMVRAVSSGTEATMSALRLARGFTGKDKIVKIDGGYHGHADMLLVEAGSGAATQGISGSAGVPQGAARDTLVAPWNDLAAMRALFELPGNRGQIAALIVEPIPGNIGCVPPGPGYLEGLRELCTEHGVLLIFDEVMTCFRVAWGGAQLRYGIKPDLTCLGKVVGGGLPAAAFGGRADVMSKLAPLGPVYQAGTLSGNPLALAAGLATIDILARPGTYEHLEKLGARLEAGLRSAAAEAGVATQLNRVGAMFTSFFAEAPVVDYATAKKSDTQRFGRFFRGMLARGIYLAPSQFEAAFLSLAHTEADIDQAIVAARAALAEAK
jgi:glutamate-1-semialdehyde 2,1-aminomutase